MGQNDGQADKAVITLAAALGALIGAPIDKGVIDRTEVARLLGMLEQSAGRIQGTGDPEVVAIVRDFL